MGDFNVNYQNNNTTKFKTTMNTLGYKQIVKTPTRITDHSSTLIDLIFTNEVTKLSPASTVALSLSDHDICCSR